MTNATSLSAWWGVVRAAFILFSMAGGYFADHFSKRSVTIGIKVFEIFCHAAGVERAGGQSALAGHRLRFLMEVHSAIFGPSKYGLLPELLPERRLSWGNGVLELGTFISIIGGTVVGALLCKAFAGRQGWSGAVLVGLAGLGLFTSLGISKVPAADPAKKFRANFLADLWVQIKLIRKDRVLWLATLGNTYFFTLARCCNSSLSSMRKMCSTFPIRRRAVISRPRPPSALSGSFAAGIFPAAKSNTA